MSMSSSLLGLHVDFFTSKQEEVTKTNCVRQGRRLISEEEEVFKTAFAAVDNMESVEGGSALDLALDSLDMLSTVTSARRDYLNELKARGIRPIPSLRTLDWAYGSSLPPSYGSRRKENVMDGDGVTMQMLYCASSSPSSSSSSPTKIVRRMSQGKFRPSPYSTFNRSQCSSISSSSSSILKRKPLNALLNPVTPYSYFSIGGGGGSSSSRTRASDSWSSDVEVPLSPYNKDMKIFDLSDPCSSSLFHMPPQPPLMMARSKSLEDLPTIISPVVSSAGGAGGSSTSAWNCPVVDDAILAKVALQMSKGGSGLGLGGRVGGGGGGVGGGGIIGNGGSEGVDESMSMLIEKLNVTS